MPHVIVHAGFHKTGTTSVQNTLRANRDLLDGTARIYLRSDMIATCEAARAFSAGSDASDLIDVRNSAAAMAVSWHLGDLVLMSSEDLSGHMPGRKGLKGYQAAPALLQALCAGILDAQPAAQLTVFFGTRGAEAWLRSCHAQHVRVTRHQLDAADYAERYKDSAKLDADIARVAAALDPINVTSARLEDCVGPLGPLDPILDLAELPPDLRATLRPAPRANAAASPEGLAQMLALNRGHLRGPALRNAKRAIMGLPAKP